MQPPKAAGARDALPKTSRYELLVKIAAGGMATVYVGRSTSRREIRRLHAIKRAHAHLADDPIFRQMFVAEARLASKIHHPNVVAVQDVEELDDELLLVMDYVEGESLAGLRPLDPNPRVRARLAARIVLDACAGLHAAHELTDDSGRPLQLVHRDVSPHNILVGRDGVARLTDFGIAKSNSHTAPRTATGGLKGKLHYMAPEYVSGGTLDRRADVFALGVVLWEVLTRKRLFDGDVEVDIIRSVAACEVKPPSSVADGLPCELDDVVLRALAKTRSDRFPTAAALAEALEAAARRADAIASHVEVGAAVERLAGEVLEERRALVRGSAAPSADSPTDAQEDDEGAFGRSEDERTDTLAGPERVEATIDVAPTRPYVRTSVAPRERRQKGVGIALGVMAALTLGSAALVLRSRTSSSSSAAAPPTSAPAATALSDRPSEPAPSGDLDTVAVSDLPLAPSGRARTDAPRASGSKPPRGDPRPRTQPAASRPPPPSPPPATDPPAPSSAAPPNPYRRDGGH